MKAFHQESPRNRVFIFIFTLAISLGAGEVSMGEPPSPLPAKKTSQQKAPSQKKSLLATKLPAYKGKKRVTVSYDQPTETQVVIVSAGTEGEKAPPPPENPVTSNPGLNIILKSI